MFDIINSTLIIIINFIETPEAWKNYNIICIENCDLRHIIKGYIFLLVTTKLVLKYLF